MGRQQNIIYTYIYNKTVCASVCVVCVRMSTCKFRCVEKQKEISELENDMGYYIEDIFNKMTRILMRILNRYLKEFIGAG